MMTFPVTDDHWLAVADSYSKFIVVDAHIFYCMWQPGIIEIAELCIPGNEMIIVDGRRIVFPSAEPISGAIKLCTGASHWLPTRKLTISLVVGRPENPDYWFPVFSFLNCTRPLDGIDQGGARTFLFHGTEGEVEDAREFLWTDKTAHKIAGGNQ